MEAGRHAAPRYRQPAASQPCRGWACPWAVRPSHGLLQLPLQARRRAWPPWAWGGGAACAPRMAEKLMKVSKRPSVGETDPGVSSPSVPPPPGNKNKRPDNASTHPVLAFFVPWFPRRELLGIVQTLRKHPRGRGDRYLSAQSKLSGWPVATCVPRLSDSPPCGCRGCV